MAMQIVIDGYNLIRQSPNLRSLDRDDLQSGRDALIELLRRYKKIKRCHITLVFDAERTGHLSQQRTDHKGIQIIYSRQGEKADDVIKRIVSVRKKGIIIVSSDREVAHYSEKKGATVISSQNFEELLNRAVYMEQKGELPEEDPYSSPLISTRKKGPARRLPKKMRQANKRMKKL